MQTDIRLLITNTGLLFSSRSLVLVARGIYSIALARFLGPEIYGLYNYGLSWYLAFMPIAFWGISFILSREVGRSRGDASSIREIVSRAFTTRLITSVTAALGCLIAATLIEEQPGTRYLLLTFSLALLGRSLAIWCSDVFVASERAALTFKLQSSLRLLEVLIGICLLWAGLGLKSIVVVHLCSWWLEAIIGMALVYRRISKFRFFNHFSTSTPYLRQGLPLTMMDLASTWFMVGPVILYRHLSNDGAGLGELTFALQVFFLLVSIVASFSIAILPLMSRLSAAPGEHDMQLTRSGYKAGFLFASLAIVSGTALAPFLVNLLLTQAYAGTDVLMAASLWLLLPVAATAILQQRMIAAGRDRAVLYTNAIGALLMTAVFPGAVADQGSMGAILAAGVGLSTTFLLQLALFTFSEGLTWLRDTCAAILTLALSYGVCLWLLPVADWLAGLVSASLAVGLFLFLVFDVTERRMLLALISDLLSRRPPA